MDQSGSRCCTCLFTVALLFFKVCLVGVQDAVLLIKNRTRGVIDKFFVDTSGKRAVSKKSSKHLSKRHVCRAGGCTGDNRKICGLHNEETDMQRPIGMGRGLVTGAKVGRSRRRYEVGFVSFY